MNLDHLRHIYFLGIGGIGMSALARYFKSCGMKISGYDKTPTLLTKKLIMEGMDIHFEDNPEMIREDIDLFIYTPAIPSDLHELKYIIEKGYPLKKRAQVLGDITKDKFTIAIAGTHGKTSISSMIAHMFYLAGIKVTAIIGGIINEYGSNYIGVPNSDVFIVEADEYDRSFLTLSPDIGLVSSMDADHLDVYGKKLHIEESFNLFAQNIKQNGTLISKLGLNLTLKPKDLYTYSLSSEADYYCKSMLVKNAKYIINVFARAQKLKNIECLYSGKHNIENAVGAIAVADCFGLNEHQIREGIYTYPGVKRRFEKIFISDKIIYIDDYAHHPAELEACIISAREFYPGENIIGVFQPHLYSRTRDFANEFARSLELLDEIVILDIYPAREKPIEGIDAAFLLKKINHPQKHYKKKNELLDFIKAIDQGVLLTLGAGDIDKFVKPIKEILESK